MRPRSRAIPGSDDIECLVIDLQLEGGLPPIVGIDAPWTPPARTGGRAARRVPRTTRRPRPATATRPTAAMVRNAGHGHGAGHGHDAHAGAGHAADHGHAASPGARSWRRAITERELSRAAGRTALTASGYVNSNSRLARRDPVSGSGRAAAWQRIGALLVQQARQRAGERAPDRPAPPSRPAVAAVGVADREAEGVAARRLTKRACSDVPYHTTPAAGDPRASGTCRGHDSSV